MIMNMVVASGSTSVIQEDVTIHIYGEANEFISITGISYFEITLDENGYGSLTLPGGYWTFVGDGSSSLFFPNGLTTVINSSKNTIYMWPETAAYVYGGQVPGVSWEVLSKSGVSATYALTGSSDVGWSTEACSNSSTQYWCKIGPSTPISVLKSDGTKYSTCKIIASGKNWALGYNSSSNYTPNGNCRVGIEELSKYVTINGTKKLASIDISSLTGDTITPYAYASEQGDPGGSYPGSYRTKTTVFAIWFE